MKKSAEHNVPARLRVHLQDTRVPKRECLLEHKDRVRYQFYLSSVSPSLPHPLLPSSAFESPYPYQDLQSLPTREVVGRLSAGYWSVVDDPSVVDASAVEPQKSSGPCLGGG